MKTLRVLVWVEGLKHSKSAFSNAVTMISADEVRTGLSYRLLFEVDTSLS